MLGPERWVRAAFFAAVIGLRGAGCWGRRCRSWRIDAGTHQEKKVHDKDDDEDEASDEDVGPEAHHGFVAGKVRRWDVFVLVVAFVVVFGHAHKLTLQMRGFAA
jgi:hypothetical protein